LLQTHINKNTVDLLNRLLAILSTSPNLRLGQIIYNAIKSEDCFYESFGSNLFYISNNELIDKIESFIKEHPDKKP